MTKLNFTWRKQTGHYQIGENLFLNRIYIASCSWNGARTQTDALGNTPNSYVGDINLPSLSDKVKRLYANNLEELKPKIERIVENWFNEALKEE